LIPLKRAGVLTSLKKIMYNSPEGSVMKNSGRTGRIIGEIRKLLETNPNGVTAMALSERLGLKRSTVSFYLNDLEKRGLLQKTSDTSPVLFTVKARTFSAGRLSIDDLLGAKLSLKSYIAMCKAATIYPTNGLPILLCGESGTGKSMLAKCIYNYAIDRGVISDEAKFVELNCADYAHNPELLFSVMFGHVRGAFTGANEDRDGLISEADGGYLFLDEVHRLSNENQEKLFILMDSGQYRRLGEHKGWHKACIRFIFATSVDPDQVMLETFMRRIPMHFTLPNWSSRTLLEKIIYIYLIFLMKKQIYCSGI
jgi:transcriptional regulator with AAA-type ATPase domain